SRDFEKLFPGEVGIVSSDKTSWGRINICMVKTLGNRMKKSRTYRDWLAKVDIVIVDEGDKLIGTKVVKEILNICYNAPCRICLSGTPLKNKDKTRNQEQLAFFGPIIHTRTNRENVEDGISAKPLIRFHL